MFLKTCFMQFAFILSTLFVCSDDSLLGELTHDGPSTPEQLSLYLPVLGSVDEAIIAHVQFKKKGESKWLIAHPLHRIRPSFTSRTPPKPAYAGVIWDLTPGSTYEIEVKLKVGSDEIIKKASLTTRELPPVAGAATKTIAKDSDTKAIQAVFDSAQPGDVIEIEDGTYNVSGLQIKIGGSKEKPIYIRGKTRKGVVLKANSGRIFQVLGCSNVIVENMTLEGSNQDSGTKSSSQAVSFWNGANSQENFTFRNLVIRGVDMGIIASKALLGALVYDNTLIGNNLWKKEIITTNSTWNDDGVRIPGQGNAAFNNTLTGFGDCLAMSDHIFNAGVHFYRNDIIMTGDDAFEGDYGHRNITFYDNRIQNSQTFLSMDPMLGGPVFCFRNISINTGRGPYKLNNKNSGLLIYNNTVIRTNGFGSGKGWGWVQFNNGPIDGWAFCNNILVWKGSGGTFALESKGQTHLDFTNNAWFPDGSIWWTGSGGSAKNLAGIQGKLPPSKPVFGNSTKRHENDIILGDDPFEVPVKLGEDFLTEITTPYEPALKKESKAKNKGRIIPGVTDGFSGEAPDIGGVIEGRPTPIRGDRTK